MTQPLVAVEPGRRGRRRPGIVALFLTALLVLLAVAGTRAALAARDLQQARSLLEELTDHGAEVDLDQAQRSVDGAQRLVDRAAGHMSRPSVRLVASVPVVGRSVAAERAVVEASQSALSAAALVVRAAPDLAADGGVDVDVLAGLGDRLGPMAEQAAQDLEVLRSTPTGATPGVVQDAVSDAEQALGPVVDGLVNAADGLPLVADLLGAQGPRAVMVALQNNAELRGTGGYVSTFAVGSLRDGRLELEPFQDVIQVNDPPEEAKRVPAPEEFAEDFGVFLADTTLWREWNMSPDVPDAASVTAEVADDQLGVAPSVVIMLDVPALARIVAVTDREVRLPDGSSVAPDDLTEALLVDSYAAAGADVADQDARRAELRAAAGQTVSEILTDDAAPLALARELGRLAQGRHLAVWSSRPEEQQRLEALGLAGSADAQGDDTLLVSVNNLNANKLDYYVDRSVEIEATVSADRVDVLQRVVLTNRAPADLVPYVAGETTPGTVVERVELSVSADAQFRSLRKDGEVTTGGVRRGAERTRVYTYVTLPRGAQLELALRYTVPVADGRYRLRLLPQPLARDAELQVKIAPAEGLQLVDVAGAELVGGRAVRGGAFDVRQLVDVTGVPAA